ncbi:MAG: hypothetical protein ABIK83_10710 [Candidatus Zixiibacteriota bacterium]
MIDEMNSGVDFRQLKHLVKIALKLDIRSASGIQPERTSGKFPPMFATLLFYFFVSIGLAVAMYAIPSIFTAALIVVTIAMTFVAINVLIEFGGIILSPDDFEIISPLPVNSRTFFYAKVANLLIYTSMIAASLGLAPTVALAVRTGSDWYLVLLPLVFLLSTCFVSFTMAGIYTSLLNYVSRERLSSALGYAQMLLGTMVYFCYIVVPKLFAKDLLQLREVTEWWIFLIPSAWFTSFFGLTGDISTSHWIWSAMLGLSSVAMASIAGARFLSVRYASALSRSARVSDRRESNNRKVVKSGRTGIFAMIKSPEQAVVFKLIWVQFKYDKKFKMGVLAILPLTLLYLFMGITDIWDDGGVLNPFQTDAALRGGSILTFIAPGLLPVMVIFNVLYSASYKSSWIFFSTPSDLREVIFATVRFMQYVFVIPYLIVLCVVLCFIYGNALHSIMMILLLYFLIQIVMLLVFPFVAGVPFGLPTKTGQQSAVFVAILAFLPLYVIPIAIFSKLTKALDPLSVYGVYIVSAIILERIALIFCGRRIAKKAAEVRYAG